MTLRLLSWEPTTETVLVALVRRLAPSGGYVAAGGPDAAVLRDRGAADEILEGAGDPWWWGRAFDHHRELLWRCEGDRRSVVLALDGDEGAIPALNGAEEHPPAGTWEPVKHDEHRPGRLLLWHRGEQRLPRPPRLPSDKPLAIQIKEYDGPDGVAWRRYLQVVEA